MSFLPIPCQLAIIWHWPLAAQGVVEQGRGLLATGPRPALLGVAAMRRLITQAATAAASLFSRRLSQPAAPSVTVTRDTPQHQRWREDEEAQNRVREFAKLAGTSADGLTGLQRRLMAFGRPGAFLARILSGGRRMSPEESRVANQVIDVMGRNAVPTPGQLRDLTDAMERATNGADVLPTAPRQPPVQGPPQTMSGDGAGAAPAAQADWSSLVRTPNSTNVYSLQYHYPSQTLYVRFQAPDLNPDAITHHTSRGGLQAIRGQSGKTVLGQVIQPGPLYAYYAVPKQVFRQLILVANEGNPVGPGVKSPGTGVWELLRIRGSRWAHHFKYRLIEGSEHTGPNGTSSFYVPRKVTADGYRSRSMNIGRNWARSSLPATGRPNRGVPNRGRRSL